MNVSTAPKTAGQKIRTVLLIILLTVLAAIFLLPIILTVCNSFMDTAEIAANYGKVFSNAAASTGKTYIAEKINLKFIPDRVSFSQYATVLLKSPSYLLKFWNSVILVLPIVIFQTAVALGASYAFARYGGKLRSMIFFLYIIIMLIPYQVTLVPNFIVSGWLGLLDTYWSIILPGIFSPFAVFILTKQMKRVPKAVVEAAKLDGAGEWKLFTKIYVPMCRSIVWSVAILIFMDYWNMVEQPLVMLTDTDLYPLSIFLAKINAGDVGVAFAVATVYLVPALLLFSYGEEYLIEGISNSSSIVG